MTSSSSAAFALAAMAAAAPALAADLEAASKIDAVTVYPDAASVTRKAEIELPAGASTLVFRGLPAALDPASLRVEGQATGDLAIGAVETRATPAETKPDTELEAKLRALREKRDTLQATIDALDGKRGMMKRFAEAGPDKLGADDKPFEVAQWAGAWDAVGAGLARVNEEMRVAQAQARDLDAEIAALEATRQRPQPGRAPRRDVAVSLEAGGALKATLTLTYRVAGASWRPTYEARLDTSGQATKPKLDFVRRATVTQRTGEDWSEVELSVSTTRARSGVAAPQVHPTRLAFWEPPPQPVPMARAPSAPQATMQSGRSDGAVAKSAEAAPPAPPPPRPAVEQQASVEASAFQASFRAPGRMSVPGEGAPKSFRVSSRSLTPDLMARAAPLLDETAYLEAKIVNEEEAPLLPGDVAVFRDGGYVGTGRIRLTPPGDATELGFGADDRVKVTRAPVRRKENEPSWLGSTKTEIREFRTTVKNLHKFPIRAEIVDQIPFSENSAIVIEQLPATTAPTEKQVGDRRGVMAWSWTLQPDEQKEVRLAFRMKWPADREVVFETVPVQRNAR